MLHLYELVGEVVKVGEHEFGESMFGERPFGENTWCLKLHLRIYKILFISSFQRENDLGNVHKSRHLNLKQN